MRPMMLLLCLALGPVLAGCVTDGGPSDAVSGAQASAAAAKPAEPDGSKKQAAKKKEEKKDEWWKEGGVTKEKVSAMCWMKYEKGRKDLGLDARAELVNKCVADTMRDNPPTVGIIR